MGAVEFTQRRIQRLALLQRSYEDQIEELSNKMLKFALKGRQSNLVISMAAGSDVGLKGMREKETALTPVIE